MSVPGASAANSWAVAPVNCPPQHTRRVDAENAPLYYCTYAGEVSVRIDGAPWSRTWWSLNGDSVTEYTPAAKAKLGTWDTRFDDDYAAWLMLPSNGRSLHPDADRRPPSPRSPSANHLRAFTDLWLPEVLAAVIDVSSA